MATNDFSRFAVGLLYDMDFEMSEVILRGNENKPIDPDQLFLQDLILNHEETGDMDVEVIPKGRTSGSTQKARDYKGNYLGGTDNQEAVVTGGEARFNTRGKAEGMETSLKSTSHLPVRISTINVRGNSVVRRRPV